MAEPKTRYWDSSVFLANITNKPAHHGQITEDIIQLAVRGECRLITSAITLGEVLRPGKKSAIQMDESTENQIKAFFLNPWIKYVDLTPTMGAMVRRLIWDHELHVRDAVHIASALHVKAEVIEAYDPDFLKVDKTLISNCPPIREPSLAQSSLITHGARMFPAAPATLKPRP